MARIEPQFYYKKNRLQQLKGFYYTAQCRSFSKAAEKMCLTQSTITLQLQSLERDLGVKLLERNAKKVELTKEGEMFYSYCIPYIQGLDDLFENFKNDLSGFKSSTIKISANNFSIFHFLPKVIKDFKLKYPEVYFTIKDCTKNEAFEDIIDSASDLAIYSAPSNSIPEECDFTPISSCQIFLLMKKNHPLSKQKDVRLSDIAKYELIKIRSEYVTLPNFEEMIKLYKFNLKMDIDVSDWAVIKQFVKEGIGIGLVPDIVLGSDWEDDFDIKDLSDCFPKIEYGIITKKNKIFTPLFKEFFETVKSHKI